jgi:signal transduction histidine kinase/ActR/RegA family two-component response regulator
MERGALPSRWIPVPDANGAARYVAPVAIVAVATALRALLGEAAGLEPGAVPFISFFPAVLLAAWYGGLRPGVLALALSTVAAVALFVRWPLSSETVVTVTTFVLSSGLILAIAEAFHRASRRADRSEALLRFAQQAAAIGSFELAGGSDVMSPELCELLGLDPAAKPLPALRERIHPEDRAAFDRSLAEALVGFVPLDVELRLLDPERWIALKGRARSEAGGERRVAGVAFDASLRKRADRERERVLAAERAAREAAEAGARARDTFLATMSHELRTPLSPILAWGRMLADGALDEEQRGQAVATILRCARAQAQLVEDLLDVSRIVSGKLRLDVRPVPAAPVVEAALAVVRPAAEAKGIRLQTTLDSTLVPVAGDPERLQQVVWNLLTNAIKFTPKGGSVQVVLERVNSHVEIAVRDTGPGIDPEFLPHVFDRFSQAETGSTRTHGGLGLGLSIARHLVEAHGGTIHAENAPAGGSIFTIKLPVMALRIAGERERRHPDERKAGIPSAYASLDGCRALLVDDEPESNEVVRTLLASCGAEVRVAGSADHALEILDRWKPDVLVSDVGMPGKDGYALIAAVRARGDNAARLPAIALTAYASVEDRIRLLSAGFQAHVAKPLELGELVAVVSSLYRAAQEGRG